MVLQPCVGIANQRKKLAKAMAVRVALLAHFPYNCLPSGTGRAVSSVVRAPRSHRGGRRFKSSIAHHLGHT